MTLWNLSKLMSGKSTPLSRNRSLQFSETMNKSAARLAHELEKVKRQKDNLESRLASAQQFEKEHTCPGCHQCVPDCQYPPKGKSCCQCLGRRPKIDEFDAADDNGFRCVPCSVSRCEARLLDGSRCGRITEHGHRYVSLVQHPLRQVTPVAERVLCCVCAAWPLATQYDKFMEPCGLCTKKLEPLSEDLDDVGVLMQLYNDGSVGEMWQ